MDSFHFIYCKRSIRRQGSGQRSPKEREDSPSNYHLTITSVLVNELAL